MHRPLPVNWLSFAHLSFACLALSFFNGPARAEQPNIVIILVDDMGWSNIGCYGGMVETPNLDALATNGVRFSQFYNGARCCPTRATLMTGLHPHQAGVGHMTIPVREQTDPETGLRQGVHKFTAEDREFVNEAYKGWLKPGIPTLPEMLRDAGYGTYHTGKWHLAFGNEETWPLQCGFDKYYGHLAGGSDFFRPTNLYRGNEPVQPEGDRYYITDAISEEAIGFLAAHDSEKDEQPFFLYLSYNAPHFPLQCMPEDYERYRGRFREGWDELRARRLEQQKEMGLVPANTVLSPRPDDVPAWEDVDPQKQDEMDAIMATYAAMIDRVDQNIGKLVSHLEETGELENTLIFFLSDNGGEAESGPFGVFEFENLGQYGNGGFKYGKGWATLSNTPFREYKHYTHQGGIQTPLIVHWPSAMGDRPANSILNQYGYLPDIVETCMEAGGAMRPNTWDGVGVPQSQGISMLPLLKGNENELHTEPICIEHEGNKVVRSGNWKLVAYFDQPWELFDIESDRSEINNVAEQNPGVVAELAEAYDQWANFAGVVDWEVARTYSVYRQPDPERDYNKDQMAFQLAPDVSLGRFDGPYIVNRGVQVTADVHARGDGVIVAQGGSQYGWSLYLEESEVRFAVCNEGERSVVECPSRIEGESRVRVKLTNQSSVLIYVNEQPVMEASVPALIASHPGDGLQVGRDLQGRVGPYDGDNPFEGEVKGVEIVLIENE
ncbi:MAG: arylsulfatase [Planctomycetota bacterium]